ncbi:MAG: hypothetical protein LAO78_27710 [Acidobacteriia bacterium]|nr:hypothetical protein [Terriglobia bacterium]
MVLVEHISTVCELQVMIVGGKWRIFSFSESAPTKAFCKPLKKENYPFSLFPEEFKKA